MGAIKVLYIIIIIIIIKNWFWSISHLEVILPVLVAFMEFILIKL